MSREFELRVINKPSFYIEAVSLLNMLINDREHEGIKLNDVQRDYVNLLRALRIKGLELFELYLYDDIPDIHTLEDLLRNYSQVDFLYLLCGEELSRKEIKLLVEDFELINKMIDKNNHLSVYNCETMRIAFEDTIGFIDNLIDIFKLLNPVVMDQLTKEDIYKENLSKISVSLKSKVPLDVAQEIMGKKFQRVFDFETYYFTPSYFFMNRPMRTFNAKTQVVIYPIHKDNDLSKDMLANALKIIGDNTRLEIIEKISKKPMYGKELANELGIVTSTVSHHLEQLRSIGLIYVERDKNTKYFSINRNEYNKLCDKMRNFISRD